jgi:hypothetical protein
MITQENKESFLLSLNSDTVTASDMFILFNKKLVGTPGKQTVEPPLYYVTDPITIKKGQMECVKEDIKTTVGRYMFNLITVNAAFKGKIPYVNKTLNGDEWNSFHNSLIDSLLMKEITGAELGKFHTRIVWLNNFTEMLVPSASEHFIVCPKEIKDFYNKLCEEHKDIIDNNDDTRYVSEIETPAIDFAKKWFKDHINENESYLLFAAGGKLKFKVHFKNMFISTGIINDITDGKNKITTHSYGDGIDPKEQTLLTNQGIEGAYGRAVNTQFGGYKTKQFAVAFQSQVVDTEDCGTDRTIGIDVTEKNLNIIKWRYIRDPEHPTEFICVTPDKLRSYIGKHVEYRSPMFCMADNYCWRCMGELYKRMGLKNCGLASQKLTSTFLNKSLKAFHDLSAKPRVIDWSNSLFSVEETSKKK